MEPSRRQELLHHRDTYIRMGGSQSDMFDRNLLLLSGGALGLSAVLIESTGWLPSWQLFVSWIAFSASICLVLASFKVSEKQFEADIETIDQALRMGEEVEFKRSIWSKNLGWVNGASGVLFLVGVAFLLWFSTQAITNQREVEEMESKRGDQVTPVEKGAQSRTPPPVQQTQTGTQTGNTSPSSPPTNNDKDG